VHRQNENAYFRVGSLDLPRSLDAVYIRHRDIHQHNIGLQTLGLLQGLATVLSLANDLHIGLCVKHHLQAGTQNRVVVGEQNTYLHKLFNSRDFSAMGG
jgi:hypothetical protein